MLSFIVYPTLKCSSVVDLSRFADLFNFNADPEPTFHLMRIRILVKVMRICVTEFSILTLDPDPTFHLNMVTDPDPDPATQNIADPQPWILVAVNFFPA